MRHIQLVLALSGLSLLLSACGGGGGGSASSSSGGTSNAAPLANAGNAQNVNAGALVTLNGSGTDSDGSIAGYAWTQTAGGAVTLTSTSTATPSFTAPAVTTVTTLTFSLVVTDNRGARSTAATVDVTVNPVVSGNVAVTGKVQFERVPFATTGFRPLNYASPQLRPSRGVIVRALSTATPAVELDTDVTDASGNYSLTVPANANVIVEVVARMQKTGTAPTWDVRVQDGTAGTTPYTFRTAAFASGSGGTQNIDIPTGIDSSGQATGTRASAPFAILDTLYTAQQAVIGVSPSIVFPTLIVDWGTQAEGTFYSSGNPQHIALLADLTEDTDEFDAHVIAHEFGHYLEHNFSRADSIGGAHGLGDRLDPRVAFGEGWGYAFAAIVLNDPLARDSFVTDVTPTDNIDNPVPVSGGFNIELNPATNPPGTNNDNEGCWCSESSVWSILWDIFDAAVDGNDSVALGLQPIWNVLISPQKNTPAYTTIFSFVDALKTAQAASAPALNLLVGAQNIEATTIEPFASTENHVPASGLPGNAQVLPVYSTVTRGGAAVTLLTSGVSPDLLYNKLGNRRYVRYEHDGSVTSFTVTATSTGADPDFIVRRPNGLQVLGFSSTAGVETVTINNATAGTYLIDVYDCANGCAPDPANPNINGTPGNFTLTVAVN